MNTEMNSSPQNETKPPARAGYRKMAWVVAIVSYLMAVVAGTGLMEKEGRLTGVAIFLFNGYIFTTIAMTGYWPFRRPTATQPEPARRNHIFLAVACLTFCAFGLDGLLSAAGHSIFRWLTNLATVVFGAIGFLASLWVLWRQRRGAEGSSRKKEV